MVLVVGLKAGNSLKNLDLLLDDNLVRVGQMLRENE